MQERYGLWIEWPGKWHGWFGMALGDTFTPMAWSEDEAQKAATDAKANGQYVGATLIEARRDPPETLPWNEAEWDRHHGREARQ